MLEKRLARNLRKIRLEHKWSQETAAELCDISERYWGKLERGQAAATIVVLEKLERGLQIPATELLSETLNKSEDGAE